VFSAQLDSKHWRAQEHHPSLQSATICSTTCLYAINPQAPGMTLVWLRETSSTGIPHSLVVSREFPTSEQEDKSEEIEPPSSSVPRTRPHDHPYRPIRSDHQEFDKARTNLEAILKQHRGFVGELKVGVASILPNWSPERARGCGEPCVRCPRLPPTFSSPTNHDAVSGWLRVRARCSKTPW